MTSHLKYLHKYLGESVNCYIGDHSCDDDAMRKPILHNPVSEYQLEMSHKVIWLENFSERFCFLTTDVVISDIQVLQWFMGL